MNQKIKDKMFEIRMLLYDMQKEKQHSNYEEQKVKCYNLMSELRIELQDETSKSNL